MRRSFLYRSFNGALYFVEYTLHGRRDGMSSGEIDRVLGYSISFGWWIMDKKEDRAEVCKEREEMLDKDLAKFNAELHVAVKEYRKERGL